MIVRRSGVTFLAIVMTCCGAMGIQTDYYAGNALNSSNPLNLAHVLISIGRDDDVNGEGSRDPQTGASIVGNGIPDGVEFSVLEYVYDNPSVPNHAAAVAAFDGNMANLWAAYGCPPGAAIAFWNQHPNVYCDNFGTAPQNERICWDANLCDPMSNPFAIRTTADQTVSENTEYYANVHYLLCFGFTAPLTTVFDFVNGMTVNAVTMPGVVIDRSLLSQFGVNGDFDGDGQTNLQEWNAVVAAVRALTPTWNHRGTGDTVWLTIPTMVNTTSSRASKDQMIGWYIDAAILNQAYSPALFDLATGIGGEGEGAGEGEGEGEGEAEISISGGGWAEVGDRVEITATLAGATGYQWYKDNGAVGGEDMSTLVIDPVALGDAGEYFCRLTTPGKATVDTPKVTLQVFGAGTLPVASGLGLAALAGLCAIAGTKRYRRRH